MIAHKSFDLDRMIDFMKKCDNFFIDQLHINNLTLEEYANKLCTKGTVSYLEDNSAVVAMLAGYTDDLTNGMAYVSQVYVLPKYRGKGLGRIVISDFLNYCRGKNIDYAWLTTQKDNYAAQNLYTDLGFKFDNNYEDNKLVKMIVDLRKN